MRQAFRGWKPRVGLALILLFALLAVFGPLLNQILGMSPTAIDYEAIAQPPSETYWLGTNTQGQNILAQLIAGARGSMTVGVLAGVLSTVIAVIMGVVPGYFGGRTDSILTFVTNLFMVMPVFALILIVAGYIRNTGVLVIALIIGVFGWAGGARTLRAQTLSLRRRDFVIAMRQVGESDRRIVTREVLPHLAGWISAMFLSSIVAAVLSESGLAFLGIATADSVTWGTMIGDAQAQNGIMRGMWWWFIPPGLCIALIGTAIGLINFAIDEVANPRLQVLPRAVRRRLGAPRAARSRRRPTGIAQGSAS